MVDHECDVFGSEGQEAIERFIFRQEAHVDLALGILAAQQRIKERIIKAFLKDLNNELSQQVSQMGNGWKVVDELSANPFECMAYITIAKETWHDLYGIALGPEFRQARGFLYGVWNDWNKLQQRLDGGRIKVVLDGHIQSGKISKWWPYYKWADPYRDWDDPKTLACLYGKKKHEAISFLSEAMLTIANIAGPVIDEIVQEYEQQQPTGSAARA